MPFAISEVIETIKMIEMENLDIRTVTIGINLGSCITDNINKLCENIYKKITDKAGKLVEVTQNIEKQFGIPIVNKRISVTPVASLIGGVREQDVTPVGIILDKAAKAVGVDFIGGFSALVHKHFTLADEKLINSIPHALANTERLCSSVNVGSTKAGINMDAVKRIGEIIKQTAELTRTQNAFGCSKFVVFANAVSDNPFMAGAFHGAGEGEAVINVGVSGPGVVNRVLKKLKTEDLGKIAEEIKKTAFKITRLGEMIGRLVSKKLGVPFGIVDLSLAPTPAPGDSIAEIIETIGVDSCGAPGTTAILALLTDAVKKGGAMATSYVGGLSGAFIPVSEDKGMVEAVKKGTLSLEKLEAMTSVCSVGIDMVLIPGDTPASTISAIIADEMAIGVINNKTTAVRIVPVPDKKPGDYIEFGGLWGGAYIMPVSEINVSRFISRGGRFPAPIISLRN